ncbi:MAG: hypothetical protein LBF65_00850 [Holosporales bacterium]|nr:hypothetical protein [Holosporales bacterium]
MKGIMIITAGLLSFASITDTRAMQNEEMEQVFRSLARGVEVLHGMWTTPIGKFFGAVMVLTATELALYWRDPSSLLRLGQFSTAWAMLNGLCMILALPAQHEPPPEFHGMVHVADLTLLPHVLTPFSPSGLARLILLVEAILIARILIRYI